MRKNKILTMQMPYSTEKILKLIEEDFSAVNENIEDFFMTDEYENFMAEFKNKILDSGIEFNFSMKEILSALPVIEGQIKENIKLELFFKAVARVFTEEDFDESDMEGYMKKENYANILNDLSKRYLEQIKVILIQIFQARHGK